MVQPIIKAVKDGLPAVFDFLNSRIVKSDHIAGQLQCETNEKYK